MKHVMLTVGSMEIIAQNCGTVGNTFTLAMSQALNVCLLYHHYVVY